MDLRFCGSRSRRRSDPSNDEDPHNRSNSTAVKRSRSCPSTSPKQFHRDFVDPQWYTHLHNAHRRRSRRGNNKSSIQDLARILLSNAPVVFITGAGLSVASGIRPFRGLKGIWSDTIWKRSTREEFRKDPLGWYNSFWLKIFPPHMNGDFILPNQGHEAIARLASMPGTNIKVITQNVDGLHSMTKHQWNHKSLLIEAHGRLGYYKCLPESDSDTDSDLDEEEQRKVKIGSRRKSRELHSMYDRAITSEGCALESKRIPCKYAFLESIPLKMIEPPHVRRALSALSTLDVPMSSSLGNSQLSLNINDSKMTNQHEIKQTFAPVFSKPLFISEPPLCPSCLRPCPPQALQFDEGYHSHGHYQFELMERWIENAVVLVFVGTSFAVSLTDCALQHAREEEKLVYNFNIDSEVLKSTARLNVETVVGDVQVTLPELLSACEEELMANCEK